MTKSTRVYKTEYICEVCTCDFEHMITLSCNHTYCYDCFKIQLKQEQKCALCQTKKWQQLPGGECLVAPLTKLQESGTRSAPAAPAEGQVSSNPGKIIAIIGHKGRGGGIKYQVLWSSGRRSYENISKLEKTKRYLKILRAYQADLRARGKAEKKAAKKQHQQQQSQASQEIYTGYPIE